jgi:anaerobic selenocysteine-containing dehydrogenase
MAQGWKQTACILCSINCGLEIALDGRRFARIRGDKSHPGSAGYLCEKPSRLDYYQNARDRLTTPLRRKKGGGFDPIDWDTAIAEIAERFTTIRDTYGGDKIFYYGGGGQGNHLGGAYAGATRAAMGSVFSSNALAQEKTGEFWVDGQLYGRPRCHTTGDFANAEVAVFIGKNPWQSHGFPRARAVLRELAKDPDRALIVFDPRRTETADLADYYVQVRPGTDAFCLSALLAILVEEELVDHDFIAQHTNGEGELFELLRKIPIASYCDRAGVPEEQLREVARRIGRAASVSMFEDLGIQQSPHSTLSSYLEKLIYIVTGNFAKRGAMNIHTSLAGLGGGRGGGRTSPVGGHRIITGLIPCNVIPDEILTDHPNRFRAMLVESANPAHSLADSKRMRDALDALDLVVVIDIAMTETARHADYVLPAPSQYEKWEATFFTLEFPHNDFQLRAPLLDAPVSPGTAGPLAEPEIHWRLVRAMGAYTDEDIAELRDAAGRGLRQFGEAFLKVSGEKPHLGPLAPVILYETLGPTLPDGARAAAVLWGAAQTCALAYPESVRRAGFEGEGLDLGNALFAAILSKRSGLTFTVDEYEDTWRRLATPDGRINLVVGELLDEFAGLADEDPGQRTGEFPFVLSAGERRTSTANTIYRDPAWRKKDVDGALRMNPADAKALGISDGGRARVTTKRGSMETAVELTDTLQQGHASLPNGLGLSYPNEKGERMISGTPPNELTASEDRDWLAGTPHHKHVPARIEAVS